MIYAEALKQYDQTYNMCYDCWAQHRELGKLQGIKSVPECVKSKGSKCERILEWIDENGDVRHGKPILNIKNQFAIELFIKIQSTSRLEKIEYKKGSKYFFKYMPTLEQLDTWIRIYEQEFSFDELELLMEKIKILYQIEWKYALN
jgi:hypothetical protein